MRRLEHSRVLQQGFSHKKRSVPAQHTQQCWQDVGQWGAVPHLPACTWEHSSPHTASGRVCCPVFPRGTMHTCGGASVGMQDGVPVEEVVSQGWPISTGAEVSPRLPSAMVVLEQPRSLPAAGTLSVCVLQEGVCVPCRWGQSKSSRCLHHHLLHPPPAAPLSAHGTSGTQGRAEHTALPHTAVLLDHFCRSVVMCPSCSVADCLSCCCGKPHAAIRRQ